MKKFSAFITMLALFVILQVRFTPIPEGSAVRLAWRIGMLDLNPAHYPYNSFNGYITYLNDGRACFFQDGNHQDPWGRCVVTGYLQRDGDAWLMTPGYEWDPKWIVEGSDNFCVPYPGWDGDCSKVDYSRE